MNLKNALTAIVFLALGVASYLLGASVLHAVIF